MIMKYADNKLSEVIAGAQDYMFGKLMKPKSRLEASRVIAYTFDDEIGECEIYFRKIYAPVSNQTDECRDMFTIECVKCSGETITITSKQEQNILEYLNERYA